MMLHTCTFEDCNHRRMRRISPPDLTEPSRFRLPVSGAQEMFAQLCGLEFHLGRLPEVPLCDCHRDRAGAGSPILVQTTMVLTDAGTLDDNQRLYVIGDIHGRADLLDQIAQAIDRDLADNPAKAATTITLGDYVDRGPDSRGVLERLARNPFPTAYVALKGNHEELFGWFMRDPGAGPQWRHLAGLRLSTRMAFQWLS